MKIPEFKTRQEAADFFDKHGLDEYLEDTEDAEIAAKRPPTVVLSVRLDQDHLSALKALANLEGRGVTTMARLLLTEALDSRSKLRGPAQLHALEDEVQDLKQRVDRLEAGSVR